MVNAFVGRGATVKVAITDSAKRFVEMGASQEFVHECYSDQSELNWKKRGDEIAHIALRESSDALVVAPLTANTLATFAVGQANNLVTNIFRAWDFSKPCFVAPSMNTKMYEHPFTKEQLDKIGGLGVKVILPQVKTMMCNERGNGAMADISDIVGAVYGD
jgi:phosphopantothenoylcysteine decarboxylase